MGLFLLWRRLGDLSTEDGEDNRPVAAQHGKPPAAYASSPGTSRSPCSWESGSFTLLPTLRDEQRRPHRALVSGAGVPRERWLHSANLPFLCPHNTGALLLSQSDLRHRCQPVTKHKLRRATRLTRCYHARTRNGTPTMRGGEWLRVPCAALCRGSVFRTPSPCAGR